MARPKLGSGKRFASLTKKLRKQGARDPGALAAFIGRKKYGAKRMAKLAAKGMPHPGMHRALFGGKK